MTAHGERRAAALEAIANALLELAAVERELEESSPSDLLIDRRNCNKELGLTPASFVAAAGQNFPAFRVSRRLTASKADVLTWLKSRTVQPKTRRPNAPWPAVVDPDERIKAIHARFVARVGRPMTDDELYQADIWMDAGRSISARSGDEYAETPDDIAAHVQSRLGTEPSRHATWRSLGLDPALMERDAENLRLRLHEEHPEMGWRARVEAVWDMWGAITEPLTEARRAAAAASRAAKKAERARRGQLGLK